MPWGRLDDGLYDHPKLDALGRSKLAGVGLWTLSISWSNRRLTDGFVPSDRIPALGGTRAIAELLADVGLFDRAPGGYLIHDFLVFNDSAVTVQSRRDEAAERQRRHRSVTRDITRESQRESQRDKGVSHSTHAHASALASRPDPSSPVLEENSPNPAERGGRVNPRANGTNPRALGTSPRQIADDATKGRTWRRNQRQLAYLRGSITEDDQRLMDVSDSPLSVIPGYAEYLADIAAEANDDGPTWLAPAEAIL